MRPEVFFHVTVLTGQSNYYLVFMKELARDSKRWAVTLRLSYDQNTVLIDGVSIFLSFSSHHQLYWYLIMKGKVRHRSFSVNHLYKSQYNRDQYFSFLTLSLGLDYNCYLWRSGWRYKKTGMLEGSSKTNVNPAFLYFLVTSKPMMPANRNLLPLANTIKRWCGRPWS